MTIKSYHSFSGFTGIFEDNGSFAVIHLMDPQGKSIRDGWVYNRTIEADSSLNGQNTAQNADSNAEIGENTFRVPDQYVTETLDQPLPESELELDWEDDGETLILKWKGDIVARISFLVGRGESKWFKTVCPWGLPLSI